MQGSKILRGGVERVSQKLVAAYYNTRLIFCLAMPCCDTIIVRIIMRDSFDKDFFKFLAGFAGILTIAIVGILAVGYYEIQNGNGDVSSQTETVQAGL